MEIEKQYQEMITKINLILSDNKVDVSNFFMSAKEENKNIHKQILDVLKVYLNDIVDTQEFYVLNKKQLNNQLSKIYTKFNKLDSQEALHDYQVYLIIKNYLFDFNNAFFKIKNGEVNFTKYVNKFILPSIGDKADLKENAKFLKNNCTKTQDHYDQLCLIILPDGTCYQTPYDHETLACWLNVNGISIKNAIRYESTQKYYDFSFTSLYNYRFCKDSDSDELIEMTHEQAEVLGTLYASLLECWKFMKPLSDEIKNSSGFGIGKTEKFEEGGISSKNLNRLSLYIGDYFNKGEYLRELKLKNNVHNPLR